MARWLLRLQVTEELTRLKGVGRRGWQIKAEPGSASGRADIAEKVRVERHRVAVRTVRVTKKMRYQDVVVLEPVDHRWCAFAESSCVDLTV